jgi:hypothetical protein
MRTGSRTSPALFGHRLYGQRESPSDSRSHWGRPTACRTALVLVDGMPASWFQLARRSSDVRGPLERGQQGPVDTAVISAGEARFHLERAGRRGVYLRAERAGDWPLFAAPKWPIVTTELGIASKACWFAGCARTFRSFTHHQHSRTPR